MGLFYLANIRFPSERAHALNIVKMCNAFVANGISVELLVSDRITKIAEKAEEYYGEKIKFSVTKIRTVRSVFLGRFVFVASSFFFALHFLYLKRIGATDLIYSRDEIILATICLLRGSSNLVWESHEAKWNVASRLLLRRGVKTVVISEGVHDFYIKKGINNEQMLVAHDAMDESFYGEVETKGISRKRLGLDTIREPIAMYIGGLDAWKGVLTFFEASSLCDAVRFVVIGGKKEEIDNFKKKYPNVLFLGARPYKELKDNQQAADILVVPNTAQNELSARYTSPLKLFAHMTSRVPIVASRVPSISSILSDEQAFFFQPDDPSSLVSAIQAVIANMHMALERASDLYVSSQDLTWTARGKNILNFLQKI